MSDHPVKYGGQSQDCAAVQAGWLPVSSALLNMSQRLDRTIEPAYGSITYLEPTTPDLDDMCTCGHDSSDHDLCFECHTYQACDVYECLCDDYTNQVWQNEQIAQAKRRLQDHLVSENVDWENILNHVTEMVATVMDV